MSFKILYVAATAAEADLLRKAIESKPALEIFRDIDISFLVTGVGSMATAWSLMNWIRLNGKPDLAINAGIAGSFSDNLGIGDVVMPVAECFADSGVADGEGFMTLFESGLADKDEFPFSKGVLHADKAYADKFSGLVQHVKAITVNTATGSEQTRIRLIKRFNPDIETMEGATFFYICIREKIPFLAIRAISNRAGARDVKKWDIPLALNNMSEKIKEMLLMLQ